MADERRREWAFELSRQLGAEIVWDQKRDVWDTRKRSLQAGFGSHVLIVQDDGVLSEGFEESVNALVEYSGDHPVGLFVRGPRARGAIRMGVESWWVGSGPDQNVATVFPMSQVPDLIKWGDSRRHLHADDPRIRGFYAEAHIDCWYTVPSLVDHRGDESLISRKAPNRRAELFGSGLTVDWSIPPTIIDKHTLNPVVWLEKDGARRTVRRFTKTWERMVAAGWK